MNDSIQLALQRRIEAFAHDITAVLEKAVADAVAASRPLAAAKGTTARQAAAKRTKKSAKPSPATQIAGLAATKPPRKKPAPASTKRAPRPAQIAASDLLGLVNRNPGQRIDELAERLGTSTKLLAEPMKALVKARLVTTMGEPPETTYRPTLGVTGPAEPTQTDIQEFIVSRVVDRGAIERDDVERDIERDVERNGVEPVSRRPDDM